MNNLLEGVAGGSSGGGGGGYDWNDETNKSKVVFLCKRPSCFCLLVIFHLKLPQGFEFLVGKSTLLNLELLKGDTESWWQWNELVSNALIEKIFEFFTTCTKKLTLEQWRGVLTEGLSKLLRHQQQSGTSGCGHYLNFFLFPFL